MKMCDRCGKHEARIGTNGFTESYCDIILTNPTGKGDVLFFCDECQEELMNWLEKGVDNGKA